MSISNIGSNPAISSIQFSGVSQVASQGTDSNGDNDASGVSRASGNGGRFASAISQALSQLGVSSGSSSTTASTASDPTSSAATQDPQQALAAFMQNLFASLQSQGGGQTTAANGGTDSDGDRDGSGAASAVSGASGSRHHGGHHGGGLSKIESGLQNLMQQISSSGTSATDSTASDSASSPLQQSFQNLLAADGASGSNVTLTSFLQTLAQNLQGATPTGNVVSTQA
ncbi:MAG TPA: hypothetical protein VMV97_15015 [Sulfuriferula sp.]|nr:hypothetical protein [Sulfuriferula sp.]